MKKLGFLFITLLLAALCVMTVCAEDKIILRWDFEDNNLDSLGTADGNDGDGYYGFGELAIVEGGANGTKYGLKIPGVEVGNGQWLGGLEPDTTYTISFWGKVLNAQPESWPNFGVNNYDEFGSYLTVWQYTEEWAQYSITFTTGFETTTAMPYTWTYGPGSCDFYIDEVIVYTGDLDKALAAEAANAPAAEVEKIDEFGAELIGKWTFEGNAVNEVTGVAAYTDGLQYVEGKNGQGAFFNKATMEFPIEFVTETDAITISMWTKWDWINNYDRLIEFFAEGDKETLAFWVCPLTNSGGLESNLYDALGNRHSNVNNGGQTQIPLEEWTNITLVAGEGEGNYRLYVNGQLAMAGTLTAPLYEYDFTKAGVGGLHYYGNTIADLTLDDIYFFDGILTDAEVASLVANGYEAPAAPVVEEPVVEEPVVEEPVVDAPVVEAPKTADAIVIIAAASILSAGTAIISKKRR